MALAEVRSSKDRIEHKESATVEVPPGGLFRNEYGSTKQQGEHTSVHAYPKGPVRAGRGSDSWPLLESTSTGG